MSAISGETRPVISVAVIAACPFPTSQGSQVLIQQMSQVLAGLGHHVHVVAYHLGERGKPAGFRIHRTPRMFSYSKLRAGPSWKKPLLDLLLAYRTWRVVKRYRIKILHAHNYEAAVAGYAVRLLTGVPVVYHSHNAMADELHSYFCAPWIKRLARWFGSFLDRHIPRRADVCIAINDELANYYLNQGVQPGRLRVLPPGSFLSELQCSAKISARRSYGITAQHCLIYTGNLDAYQDLELLFQALLRLKQRRQDFQLVIASHSDPLPYLKRTAELGVDDVILFITATSFARVAQLLQLSDLAVMPRSSWSGFPIKLVNYMAAGKAVLACQGSAKGLIHLENGYIVPNSGVEEFTAALDTLLSDQQLRDRLGRAARQTAIQHHNWARLAREIEAMYQQVLK